MLAVDSDYQLSSEEDVEDTIEEQERAEGEVDHQDEMNDLKEEGGWVVCFFSKSWHLLYSALFLRSSTFIFFRTFKLKINL